MVTHYQSSKGPLEIAAMPFPYLSNAYAKLQREDDGSRTAELDAMGKRLAELAEETIEANPRAVIGGNEPPEAIVSEAAGPADPDADPFGAVKAHMDDLLTEALNWADGTTVETRAQADEAGRLIEELRKAGEAADGARLQEKADLDKRIAEIQTRYNEYIAGLKGKHSTPGKITRAIDALKATVKPFLDKLEADRLAAVEKARQKAAAAQQAAVEAARAASGGSDLAALEEAEVLVTEARTMTQAATRLENTKVQARGGTRALGLKKTYTAVLTNPRDALLHYWATRRDDIISVLQKLAQADVDEHRRNIPGVFVQEGTKL